MKPSKHFAYDAEAGTLRFLTPQAAPLLFYWLSRGKLGEHLDPLMVLNEELAALIALLPDGAAPSRLPPRPRPETEIAYAREFLALLADRIFTHAGALGWWQMDRAAQAAFVREVAAAPYSLTVAETDFILDGVEAALFRARQAVDAARGAGE